MPASKKDRKHGKDGGGVVAAVTKHGAKFSEDTTKNVSPSPSPVISPEINPSSVSSNDHPVASPLLDAVSATSYATSNSPSTREWARGLTAGMAGSPGNLISLIGESPPTAPSSYEDSRGMRSGWSSPRPGGGYHPPSASPPTAGRRPLSFHAEGAYSPPDAHLPLAAAAARRSSMHSHYAQVRAASNPPLPHQAQPHFYAAPALDADLQSQTGMRAGEKGYYFGFDTLSPQNSDRAPGKDTVVLAGYEGGLEVFSVGKRGLDRVASLKGLRGGVYHAKVLPWTPDNSELFPLIAVVVHGPTIPPPTPEVNVEGDYDAVSADRSEAVTSASPDPAGRNVGHKMAPGFIDSYQTTVEVLSLKTGRQVSVLLEAPKIPLKASITSPSFCPPPPTGAFRICADGGNIVVSSGITGECWIYRQAPATNEHPLHFRCHGKLWTTLQQPPKGEGAQEPERGRAPAMPPRPRPQVAILSLHDRWIAYCPATPSSQITLRASVPVPVFGRAPGLATVTPPQLPPANSDLDLPLSESVVNKIMRDATQELIQGAKWVGKQGWQAWNNYWNPQPSQQPRSPTLGPRSWDGAGTVSPEPVQFPPTHGAVSQPVVKEPGMVSILDIETLGSSVNPHPVTTFAVPHGCSFLSFSPSGLSLFSASSKGDVQTVWDLMRIQYTKSSPLQAAGPSSGGGPRVRQIAQFSRLTVARIVDVAWTGPNGERLAMVTERGTVHLLDMPSSAFTWPPPRRRRSQEAKSAAAEGPASAVSIASNALSSVRDVARPLLSRQRRSNSNATPVAGGAIGDYAAHGGKVIAASISHSLGRTGNAINQLRHTGENRVSLPASATLPGPSCVIWISGKKDHSLSVLGGGFVRTFPAKRRKTASGDGKGAARLSRYTDFRVPLLPDDRLSPLVKSLVDPDEYLEFTERDLDGGTSTLVLNQPRLRTRTHDHSAESSIPQAEIESSAPYQPFHTDRRVALYETLPPQPGPPQRELDLTALMAATSLEEAPAEPTPRRKKGARQSPAQYTPVDSPPSSAAWVFGQPIAATKLDLGLPDLLEDESYNVPLDASRALPASAMERILHRTDDEEAQIVVTTRRRRGAAPARDDDGFFEDDCEVLDFADQRV
ncbi:2fda0dd4-fe37-40d6-9d27-f3a863b0a17a [Thermothielavioides terrestris]|uniref:2fda0dd4-fe37-40d6-9d27-f3a863b0a17a n=1 Tax=Thermothielavioides terrestris TaxID=2587410 RepID=A0A446BIK6_9PEZI|nr:2fda0dd4-fe37-40d6-9d27-f3a863b0a17a [Thermothielavioides terrestris]